MRKAKLSDGDKSMTLLKNKRLQRDREIRALYKKKVHPSMSDLAVMYTLSKSTIWDIIHKV